MPRHFSTSEKINIVELLSTDKRDFLIRNNGQKVKCDSLNGKFVALLYMQYPAHCNAPHPLGLLEAYNTLYAKGDFDVVFVAFTENGDDADSYDWFNKYFKKMPWLGVPFYDFGTRKRVWDYLSPNCINDYSSGCLILDKLGNVVCSDGSRKFDAYGANFYPFTFERSFELKDEMQTAIEDFSLKTLLSSPSRDYLIRNNGDKVLIADLDSKVVGLYFNAARAHSGGYIRSVYDQLKADGWDFEIVFINRHCLGGFPNEESFNTHFKTMPWLAVPFGERTCEKSAKMLDIDYYYPGDFDTNLVIMKSGVFCQLHGLKAIQEYGLEAFPFTLNHAALVEIERRSLFSLFIQEGLEFVIRNNNDKTKINVSKLSGKSVCMLFASNVPSENLPHLIDWYKKMKKKDANFEVIYVSRCETATIASYMPKEMPAEWLTLPFGDGAKICIRLGLWIIGEVMLVTFNSDGKYISKTRLADKDDWNLLSDDKFPYNVSTNTVEEVSDEIIEYNHWY